MSVKRTCLTLTKKTFYLKGYLGLINYTLTTLLIDAKLKLNFNTLPLNWADRSYRRAQNIVDAHVLIPY